MSRTRRLVQIHLRPGRSPDDEFVRTKCIRKKGKYRGRKFALGIAALATKAHGVTFRVYKCHHCSYHHLTTKELFMTDAEAVSARDQELIAAVLAATGYTEPSDFNEFCRGLADYCPARGDIAGWRELWATVSALEKERWIIVQRDGRLTTSLQLTKAGADYIRAVLDKQRGLLGLLS